MNKALKSVRIKLFLTISMVILLIIGFLIIVNNIVFGQFYLYSKTRALKDVYIRLNDYYNNPEVTDMESELERIAIKNNFDILIKNDQNVNIYTSSKDFFFTLGQMNEMTNQNTLNSGEIIEDGETYTIQKIKLHIFYYLQF